VLQALAGNPARDQGLVTRQQARLVLSEDAARRTESGYDFSVRISRQPA
jgi:hypothetical protein